jgi:hypothetical protein
MLKDKRELPLQTLEDYIKLRERCTNISLHNSRILNIEFADFFVRFSDRTSGGRFSYIIDNPRLDVNSNKSVVNVNYRPKHHLDNGEYSMLLEMNAVDESIGRWLELIKAYDRLSLDPQDRFLNQYTEEIYPEILIIDSEADSTPLNDRQQRLLIYILDGIEEAIETVAVSPPKKVEILSEVNNLKDRIPSLTKTQAISWLAKIFAKLKLLGQKSYEKIKEEASKIIIKMLLEKGIEIIKDQWPHIVRFLGL